MKFNKLLILGLALGVSLVSCKKDDEEVVPTNNQYDYAFQLKIPASIPSNHNLSLGDTIEWQFEIDLFDDDIEFEGITVVGNELDTIYYFNEPQLDSLDFYAEVEWETNGFALQTFKMNKGEVTMFAPFQDSINPIRYPLQ